MIPFRQDPGQTSNQKLSTQARWRYGNKGSLSIQIQGEKAGLWHDFEQQASGNLIQLIQRERGLSFKDALDYAGNYLHLSPEAFKESVQGRGDGHFQQSASHKHPQQPFTQGSQSINNKPTFTKEQLKKIEYARKITKESRPIEGTLAEKYLREHRKITAPKLPETLRFHPNVRDPETRKYLPALVAVAKNGKGDVQCVQVTYLNNKTANKADINIKKRSYGPQKNVSVLLQKGGSDGKKGHEVALAEGVETALSVALADKTKTVYATLGVSNMAQFGEQLKERNILICADNDGKDAPSNKTVNKAVNALIREGKNVKLTRPDLLKQDGKLQKTDFNDILKTNGKDKIKEQINNAILMNKESMLHNIAAQMMKENHLKIEKMRSIAVEESHKREDQAQQGIIKNNHAQASFVENNKRENAIMREYVANQTNGHSKEQHLASVAQAIKVKLPKPPTKDAVLKMENERTPTQKNSASISENLQKTYQSQSILANQSREKLNSTNTPAHAEHVKKDPQKEKMLDMEIGG